MPGRLVERHGKGVRTAVQAVNGVIADSLVGVEAEGANAILGASLATAKAAAAAHVEEHAQYRSDLVVANSILVKVNQIGSPTRGTDHSGHRGIEEELGSQARSALYVRS